jgi:hypothetical protein
MKNMVAMFVNVVKYKRKHKEHETNVWIEIRSMIKCSSFGWIAGNCTLTLVCWTCRLYLLGLRDLGVLVRFTRKCTRPCKTSCISSGILTCFNQADLRYWLSMAETSDLVRL